MFFGIWESPLACGLGAIVQHGRQSCLKLCVSLSLSLPPSSPLSLSGAHKVGATAAPYVSMQVHRRSLSFLSSGLLGTLSMSAWRAARRTGKRAWRQPGHGEPLQEADGLHPTATQNTEEGERDGYPTRRWRLKDSARSPTVATPATQPTGASRDACARVVWLLGNRCVELLLPSGAVRCSNVPAAIKSGSRSVAASVPGRFYVLENGSSRIWQLDLGGSPQPLGDEAEGWRFRASLGSRFVSCGPGGRWLLVTGTPHHGAHRPWLFDLSTMKWEALPEAPHAILSSAVAVQPGSAEVTILGGWSKMSSCHGHVQRLIPGPISRVL